MPPGEMGFFEVVVDDPGPPPTLRVRSSLDSGETWKEWPPDNDEIDPAWWVGLNHYLPLSHAVDEGRDAPGTWWARRGLLTVMKPEPTDDATLDARSRRLPGDDPERDDQD